MVKFILRGQFRTTEPMQVFYIGASFALNLAMLFLLEFDG